MKKAFIITVSILSIVIIVLSVMLFQSNNSLTTTSASLENLYQRSFYDLVDNVNNMETDVSKLMVTNDSTSQQKLLSSIKQKSSDAENDLSLLPVESNLLEKTSTFINKMNGYCTSLISYKEGKLEKNDFNKIQKLYDSISNIKTELNKLMNKIINGYKISENLGNEQLMGDFSSSLANISGDTVEYPSLIYDGPFSDTTLNKTIKGLGKNTITENDAENLITKLFQNKITSLNYIGETQGKFNTYDFGVNTENGRNYYIQITKQGGFLLTMNSNILDFVNEAENNNENVTNNEEPILKSEDISKLTNEIENEVNKDNVTDTATLDTEASSQVTKNAQTVALEFAKKLGLENIDCVWSASSEEICYVNLAPVIDGITMYPDLIKAKIDLNTDEIIGWEATSYAYNHVEREDLIPQLSEKDARNLISENLKVDSQKLCVIPLDYVGETLAYEFAGKYNNANYYLYVDAYTGNQVRVLRVIQTENGELVI